MPKHTNILQFSLPESARLILAEHSQEGESISLTAKRIILAFLGEGDDITPGILDRLESLESDVNDLTAKVSKMGEAPILIAKQSRGRSE